MLSLSSYRYTRLLKWFACVMLSHCFLIGKAQYFVLDSSKKKVSFRFQIIRSMIVIPLYINRKGPFNFILDTGVGLMIITDPRMVDSIDIYSKRAIKLWGYGNNNFIDAYATSALQVTMPGLQSYNVAAAIFKQDHFGLSNYMGMPIYGLIGFEFFDRLAVKLNFVDSTITVRPAGKMRPFKKGFKLPISIEERKPYLTTCVTLANGQSADRKLIIDLGAGHPVSLENIKPDSCYPAITANLGIGLTGLVSGEISRISEIELGKYKLRNVLASFPDTGMHIAYAVSRDGNLGLGVLKKFTVIIDYQNRIMHLKPNNKFNEPFEHDMSGLEYYAAGTDFSRVIISRVEPGSAGDDVGLEENDEITSINLKPVARMSIMDIDNLLRSRNERKVLVGILRDKKQEIFILTLKRRI